jgi:hypothetical protein
VRPGSTKHLCPLWHIFTALSLKPEEPTKCFSLFKVIWNQADDRINRLAADRPPTAKPRNGFWQALMNFWR